jgi:hypothetical protein
MYVEMLFWEKDDNVIMARKLAVVIAKFYLVGIVVEQCRIKFFMFLEMLRCN